MDGGLSAPRMLHAYSPSKIGVSDMPINVEESLEGRWEMRMYMFTNQVVR
jgi:hypothetical protein